MVRPAVFRPHRNTFPLEFRLMIPVRLPVPLPVAGALLGLVLLPSVHALEVGDAAPALKTGEWVQGEPVKSFDKDKVYVVEFWATWCGPCRETIPHLNEVQKKFADKGLVVIGQNVWEENEAAVAKFVKKMGDKMSYRVALDDKSAQEEGAMANTWMKASGQDGIPTAFVVDKAGKVAWIGHPMDGLDEVVASVIDGSFDPKKAREIADKQQAAAGELEAAYAKIGEAMEKEAWDDALKAVDEAEKLLPEGDRQALLPARIQILVGAGNMDKLHAYVKAAGERSNDDVEALNDLAWSLVATAGLENPDLDLAEKLATRANELAKGEEPHVLDTLARIVFMQGQRKAIALQQKAVEKAGEDDKEMLEGTLDNYRGGYLPSAEELNAEEDIEVPEEMAEPEEQDV